MLIVIDAVVLTASFFVAYYLRMHFHDYYGWDLLPGENVVSGSGIAPDYKRILFPFIFVWCWMLYLNGVYRSFRGRRFSDVFWDIVQSTCFSAGIFGAITFFLKIQHMSRLFIMIFLIVGMLALLIEKWSIVAASRYMRKTGRNYRQLLLVGTGPRMGKFIDLINKHPEWGLKIVGLVDDDSQKVGKEFFGVNVIGLLDDISRILRENVIDEVVFIIPRGWLDKAQESITDCEIQGVKTSLAVDFFNLKIARIKQTDIVGFPLLTFETIVPNEWELFLKRAFDAFVSLSALIILSPLMIVVAVLVKFTSEGPVFYAQKRVGLHGRQFTLFKFRSMYKDADKRLEEIRHLNEMDGPVFKVKNDPRITPIGKFMRKTSIDELPQLYNVLLGDMSVIGPRPPLQEEVKKYESWQVRRLSMRPGLTCLWQISGRNEISFEKWMELDLQYIDNWSLWRDIEIMIKTVPAVLFAKGAR